MVKVFDASRDPVPWIRDHKELNQCRVVQEWIIRGGSSYIPREAGHYSNKERQCGSQHSRPRAIRYIMLCRVSKGENMAASVVVQALAGE